MDTSPASLSSPCKDYIIAGNLKSGTQETWDDITFDPAEAKCSTAKTLEKELNDIQANLVFHTTSSSAASDNEFMNQEAEETWMSGPGEDSTPCRIFYGIQLRGMRLFLRRGAKRTLRKR